MYRLALLLRLHPDHIRQMTIDDFYGLLREAGSGQV